MRNKEIAVLCLPIERHDGMADTGDPGNEKLDEKGDAEQHRHLKTDSTPEHGGTPVKHFYARGNGNEHRRNREKDVKWTTHSHREHVMAPHAHAQHGYGDTRSGDEFVAEDRFARKDWDNFGNDAECR